VINTQGTLLNLMDDPVGVNADTGVRHSKSLAEIERDYIVHILEETEWKIQGEEGAAALLDLHPSTLRSKMKKLGIQRP
jgi:transcriptional regulator with GAF, ATPase, and Fis domain